MSKGESRILVKKPMSDAQARSVNEFKMAIANLIDAIDQIDVLDARYGALAQTELESAMFWITKAHLT